MIANGKNNTSNCSMVLLSDSFLLIFFRRVVVYPKGRFKSDHISLFLEVADVKSLPFGWKRLVKFRLTIAKQISEGLSPLLSLIEQGPSVLKSDSYFTLLCFLNFISYIHGKGNFVYFMHFFYSWVLLFCKLLFYDMNCLYEFSCDID